MITRSALEKLKLDWLEEPNWPIEDTEGFEAYRDELRAFRKENETRTDEHNDMLKHLSNEIGVINPKLVLYLAKLQYRIQKLEKKVETRCP